MKIKSLICAAGAVAMLAPASFGAITITSVREVGVLGGGTLDRVTLYARSDAPSGDILAADLTVTSAQPNGLKFSAPVDTDGDPETPPDTVPITSVNPITASTTRGQSVLFGTLAPGFPVPDNKDANNFPAYANGLTTFKITGLDGRNAQTTDVGLKADSSVNGGRGAAIFDAVVPTGDTVSFAGTVGDDISGNAPVGVAEVNQGTPVPEPMALSMLGLGALGLIGRRNRRA